MNVHVNGGPATSLRLVKAFKNTSGSLIPAGYTCAFDADGGIVPADANVASLSDFAGVTINDIADGAYGEVYKLGECPGVVASLGASPGDLVFLGEVPGTMSLIPPSGVTDTVLLLGRAEIANAAVPNGNATALYLAPQIISGGI